MIKTAKNKYHKNLLEENCENPAKFWKLIQNIYPKKGNKRNTL